MHNSKQNQGTRGLWQCIIPHKSNHTWLLAEYVEFFSLYIGHEGTCFESARGIFFFLLLSVSNLTPSCVCSDFSLFYLEEFMAIYELEWPMFGIEQMNHFYLD